jgi:2-dehydro-3-deoxyphosphogluconate aldolase / (4S)-4-hydroxy-2-oxoglutarate aldolase
MNDTYAMERVVNLMVSKPLIPVFYHNDADVALNIIDACYRGGMRVFEFTNRGPEAYDVFTELVAHVGKYPDAAIGIGTVMSAADTTRFIDAGAAFIVSPVLKVEMAAPCREHHVPWIPGCATLTEIVTAKENGAAIIKLFPAFVLGPQFVSAVLPVVPSLRLMPSGGVLPAEESLTAWFRAGAACAGLGSQLITKSIISNGDWQQLQNNVAECMNIVQQVMIRK